MSAAMKTGKKSNTSSHYLIAGAILLAGCAVSALILYSGGLIGNNAPAETGTSSSAVVPPARDCAVTFYDRSGNLLETKTVKQGEPVMPPVLKEENFNFKGWSEDLYAVQENLEVSPWGEEVAETKNTLCADSVYVSGKEPFQVSLRMTGEVDCTDFVITMAYDAELLAFEGLDSSLATLTVEHNAETGELILTNTGGAHLTSPTELGKLTFRCVKDGGYRTNLPKTVSEIYTDHNGSKVYTDSTAYDTNLYILEVEKE